MAISATWIDAQFPQAVGRYTITSGSTPEYNCIAFAAGSQSEWWSHLSGYKWPVRRSPLIESLVEVFGSLGFERCDSTKLENGYLKVVLYAKAGMWRHATRQLPSGKWISKLGPDEDIEHETPECLCGETYGVVHCVMRKGVR